MASKLSIVFQTPPLKGLDIALSKPRITIGRDPNNDIVIDHIEVSRKHAVIEVHDSVVTITDIGYPQWHICGWKANQRGH